jgi:hypothetical protein
MFMDRNRAVNGAKNPGDTMGKTSNKKLSPNSPLTEDAEDWRFTPDLSNPAAINTAHYQGGISGDGPYSKSYEDKIPFLGNPSSDLTTPKLKG